MRIGIYDPYLDTMSGGERYMLSIAECLKNDHAVTVFWDKEKEAEMRKLAEDRFGFDLSGIVFSDNIFTKDTSFSTRFGKSKEYDYLFILSDGSIPFVGTNLILHFQSPVEWVHPSLLTTLKLKRLQGIICNSQFTKLYIDKKFGVRSNVLYPPVQFHAKKQAKKNVILNVGRFGITEGGSSYKKQEVLAETFKHMVDDGLKGWELIFVLNLKEVNAEVREFGRTYRNYPIRIVENLNADALWHLYSSATIYWHAAGFGEDIVKYPDRAEHFGITTVEAMGAGCIPLVFAAGGQKEIVEDGVSGFLWHSLEELKQNTFKAIHDASLRRSISQQAEKRAKDFDVSHFCDALTNLLK